MLVHIVFFFCTTDMSKPCETSPYVNKGNECVGAHSTIYSRENARLREALRSEVVAVVELPLDVAHVAPDVLLEVAHFALYAG